MSVCLVATIVACRQRDNFSMEQTLTLSFSPGTTSEEVEKILTDKKIEHSFVVKDNAFHAIIRNAGGPSGLVKENISLIIYLDDKKRVEDVKATNVFTGP